MIETSVPTAIRAFAWMQLEVPTMTAEEGRAELESVGNTILEVGSRYEYEIEVNGEKKIVPAWGNDQKSAEEYLEICYPDYYEGAKLLKVELVDRCFKVAET